MGYSAITEPQQELRKVVSDRIETKYVVIDDTETNMLDPRNHTGIKVSLFLLEPRSNALTTLDKMLYRTSVT